MREIFRASPPLPRDLTDVVFYTITAEDVGKRFIHTTEGLIPLGDVIGHVLPGDVGKRLVRVPDGARDSYVWQCESNDQRDRRLSRG
jgi:hypothetical protein